MIRNVFCSSAFKYLNRIENMQLSCEGTEALLEACMEHHMVLQCKSDLLKIDCICIAGD